MGRMPAHQLTAATPSELEKAVRDLLGGTALPEAASRAGVAPDELQTAADLYHRAGTQALLAHRPGQWWQANLEFTDWNNAEDTVRRLLPHLGGPECGWWFIRKYPCWRLRLQPRGHGHRARLETALNDLTDQGVLAGWNPVVYEPETAAFGGPAGMDAAHALFHADAALALRFPEGLPLRRHEVSLVLCSALLTGAGLEWYEQGDVWARVAAERPLPNGEEERVEKLAADVEKRLRLDTTPDSPLFSPGGLLHPCARTAAAFRECGTTLDHAARTGDLQRGLRAVLAYHVIFHWNRHGLPGRPQALLAEAARSAIL